MIIEMKKWMTNEEILQVAMRQSALESNCKMEDFRKEETVITESVKHTGARSYLQLPYYCDFVFYGENIVASVSDQCRKIVEEYLKKFTGYECFSTPNIFLLNKQMQEENLQIQHLSEFFLPDITKIPNLNCDFLIRQIPIEELSDISVQEWPNALCEKRMENVVMLWGAYDGEKLIGLTGALADCESMWQIGIDVLPSYRRMGVASALTAQIAKSVLEQGKVPFYAAAWSNLKSVKNAQKCGFYPAWVQMTVRPIET